MDEPQSQSRDWVVPAILAGVALFVVSVVAIAIVYASSSDQDETAVQELETWSRCLRSEGAPVPLVESLRDGGFRVTFDAAVLDGDVDFDSLPAALDACRDEAPERFREMIDRFGMFGDMAGPGGLFGFGSDFMDGGPGHFGGDGGFFDGTVPVIPNFDEMGSGALCERVLDRIESGLPVPPRLRRVCDLSA